jgi:N-acetylmuramoyl-L-alanine amidase
MDWSLGTAARTMFQEARGEPLVGQKAVAHTFVNRMKDGRWGTTLGEVCLWSSQFSGWRSADPNFSLSCRLPDTDPNLVAYAALITAALGEADPTGGALFYYALSMPKAPIWAAAMRKCGVFGHQTFLSDRPLVHASV